MSAPALARLQKAITELEASPLAHNPAAHPTDIIRLKSEIEACIQRLDELRQKL
ncbi:hypothetical protein [Pelagibacterium xiamenense]|uniref:hypothetical protein n=1 Tax=Pelagibacterium xiamenense TaxID=2901140 RepID=UPI001E3ACC11|nr:hypothetical protein [Pelagibacterium xiamenense]MCD7061285.1 hypothetical protein [Pelagibacterium xiamenense]